MEILDSLLQNNQAKSYSFLIMSYPNHINKLIEYFKKLPGVGLRSAERFTFQLLNWRQDNLEELAFLLMTLKQNLKDCTSCGALTDLNCCSICTDPFRDRSKLLVVISQKELFSFEATGQFNGLYHVLGFSFSPLHGRSIEPLALEKLKSRFKNHEVKEVILAIDATIEGDATALYIKEFLADQNVTVSRIAFGLPQNCSLDFVDGSTLSYALKGRLDF